MSKFNRRDFLKTFGSASLFLNLAPSLLLSERAFAQSRPPLRFIALSSQNGVFHSEFWPKVDANRKIADSIYTRDLNSISGSLSGVLGNHFDGLRDKITLMRGMTYNRFTFHQRGLPFSLGGHISGKSGPLIIGSSMDAVVSNSAAFRNSGLTVDALRYSSYYGSAWFYWRKDGGKSSNFEKLPYVTNGNHSLTMRDAFNLTFGNFTGGNNNPSPMPTPPPAPSPTPVPTPMVNVDKLIMDQVGEDFKRLIASPRLSSEDRKRIADHADYIQQINSSINTSSVQSFAATNSCSKPSANNFASSGHTADWDKFVDLTVAAFACDLTRVAAMENVPGGYSGNYHNDASHEPDDSQAALAKCRQEFGGSAARIATLMRKLDSIQEFDGSTLLDNTVIMWVNEDGVRHASEDIAVMIAGGGAHGKLRMGELIDFRMDHLKGQRANVPGRPMKNLHHSVFEALGVTRAEYTKQGENGYFGEKPRSAGNAGFNRYFNNLEQLMTEKLPYFYKG